MTQWPTEGASQGTFTVGIDFMINSDFFLQAGNPAYYSVILPSRSWGHELTHTLGSEGHDISLNCDSMVFASSVLSSPMETHSPSWAKAHSATMGR